MIYIGADHAGFHLKEELKKYLGQLGYEVEDVGNQEFNPQDDYPDFALQLTKKVLENQADGILICATGIGMSIAANKVKGIRAAQVHDEFTALQAREHNKANVLCLGGKVLDLETSKKIVKIWLKARFSGQERHLRRLAKIEEMEKND